MATILAFAGTGSRGSPTCCSSKLVPDSIGEWRTSAAALRTASPIPAAYAWPALRLLDGDALFDHFRHTLEELERQPGTLALIFGKAQNKSDSHRPMAMLARRAPCGCPISGGDCQDPAKLRRVIVDLIDAENWSAMGADVKGDPCDGQLERNASLACTNIKSGAGQYFTPRALIQAMMDCIPRRLGVLIVRRREGPLDLLETPAQPAPAAPAAFCSPGTSTSYTTTPTPS